jgi:DNA-binding CsgD family transcriptional regulator
MDGPAGIIVSSGRRSPPGSFRETTVYRRLLWPCELRHLTGAAVLNTPRVHSSVWVGRSENRGEFSSRDLRPFSELVPHFGRAMAVYHRLHQAEIQVDLATGAIDRVAVGIVLLDVGGVPILVNREAKRIAASGDGFVLGDRCVAAERPGDAVRLRSLIRQVGGHTSAEGPDSKTRGGAVRLTRSSGRSDYHVVVMPLPRRCQPIDGSGAVAVVFVSDPEKSQSPVDFLFGDLYNLTDAEARLVCQLLEGRGLTAAAEQLGLSRNTVHSQLASVFQKTGTRRQGELLHLLLGGIAPVEAPDPTSGIYETDDLRENPTH